MQKLKFSIENNKLLTEKFKHKTERTILAIAIVSFIVHLSLIFLSSFGLINIDSSSSFLSSPIAATYTPFTFILVYEVYLVVYYLPQSISKYILKQYEIITLIIIRRLFKDLSGLQLTSDWFSIKGDLQFTYDLVASVVLFFLLYVFHANSQTKTIQNKIDDQRFAKFIKLKKAIAIILIPILLILAVYAFVNWSFTNLSSAEGEIISLKNINNIFFGEFFTLLIIVDVLLLLVSFNYTNEFHKVIRNSGFIISTILIRLSFGVEGLINTLLIISAVLFGLLILFIHNLYEKNKSIQNP